MIHLIYNVRINILKTIINNYYIFCFYNTRLCINSTHTSIHVDIFSSLSEFLILSTIEYSELHCIQL